jgi:alpha-beta hydrolase superfamily lysophospholipase
VSSLASATGADVDILGTPYHQRVLTFDDDDQGAVVATLVSRATDRPTGRAVLYVHGYTDYFFQSHLADFYVERGFDFYALDLRKYGRSLRPHQSPNFARSLTEYFPELDEAARIIRAEDGHDRLLVNAHSTGGLITPLWAASRPGAVQAMFLNSPFFQFNVPWPTRQAIGPTFSMLAKARPYAILPMSLSDAYGKSIHADHNGQWQYDLAWKPLTGFPPRAGWLAGIRVAHAKLHRGLDLTMPILVACSMRTYRGREWTPEAHHADAVLDPAHIAQWAPALGRHVTVVRIQDGMHDLTLSDLPARERLFAELDRWLRAYLP